MDQDPSLQQRVVGIEKRLQQVQSGGRKMAFLLGVLLLVVVSFHSWMVYQQSRRTDQATAEHHFWVITHAGSTAADRKQAFLHLLEAGNVEWQSARLGELQLRGADFDGVRIENAKLRSANLSGSTFVGAVLDGTNFETADLSESDFSNASMVECQMVKADIHNSNFAAARLSGSSLEQAEARGAIFELSELAEVNLLLADLSGADFTNADLQGARLELAVLTGAVVTGANLQGTFIDNAKFGGCNWWRAVGLSDDQLNLLTEKFAPDENWPDFLVQDYEEWKQGD